MANSDRHMKFCVGSMMRQIAVMLLISSMLVLNHCPLRKVVYHLATGSQSTGHLGKVRHVSSAICFGTADDTGARAAVDESAKGNDVSGISALSPTTDAGFRFPFAEKGFVFQRKISTLHLGRIPIYLKIRVLLI